MSIIHLIGAFVALLLALWFGRIHYHSSQVLGIIGVIIASFVATWLGLVGFGYIPELNLNTGWIISSIIATISLLAGGCNTSCNTKTTHITDTEPTKKKKKAKKDKKRAKIKSTSPTTERLDDLKKIEGIGPVLEKHLHTHGIHTFGDLADATPAFLKDILSHESKFAIHNPESWPEQATLCTTGDWDALKKLQKKLKAGRKA